MAEPRGGGGRFGPISFILLNSSIRISVCTRAITNGTSKSAANPGFHRLGVNPRVAYYLATFFSEKCMKMKETGPSVPPDPQSNNQVEMAPPPPHSGVMGALEGVKELLRISLNTF